MKAFSGEHCQAQVFVDNASCDACDALLDFIPSELTLGSFELEERGGLKPFSGDHDRMFKLAPTMTPRCTAPGR